MLKDFGTDNIMKEEDSSDNNRIPGRTAGGAEDIFKELYEEDGSALSPYQNWSLAQVCRQPSPSISHYQGGSTNSSATTTATTTIYSPEDWHHIFASLPPQPMRSSNSLITTPPPAQTPASHYSSDISSRNCLGYLGGQDDFLRHSSNQPVASNANSDTKDGLCRGLKSSLDCSSGDLSNSEAGGSFGVRTRRRRCSKNSGKETWKIKKRNSHSNTVASGRCSENKSFSSSLSRFTLPDENGKRRIRSDIMQIADNLPALPGLYFDKKQKGFRVRYQNVYVGWVALSRYPSIEEAYCSARDIWENAKTHAEKFQTPHAAVMASLPLQKEARAAGKNRGGRPRTVTQLPANPVEWLPSFGNASANTSWAPPPATGANADLSAQNQSYRLPPTHFPLLEDSVDQAWNAGGFPGTNGVQNYGTSSRDHHHPDDLFQSDNPLNLIDFDPSLPFSGADNFSLPGVISIGQPLGGTSGNSWQDWGKDTLLLGGNDGSMMSQGST